MAEPVEWVRRIPLQYLASYMGVKKETLSRLRSKQRKKMSNPRKRAARHSR